jgi:predicted RNA-binding protein associated with RNAse of E/G family
VFTPGATIVERGTAFGRIGYARPQIVVEHTPDLIASVIRVGSVGYGILPKSRETAYEEALSGTLEWGMREWTTYNAVILVRPGDAYHVSAFWTPEQQFVGWYVNLQDPIRFTPLGYDTADHTLDIIIAPDMNGWAWKDEHEVPIAIELGLHTEEEMAEARRVGESVIAMMEAGDAWWTDWANRPPDLSHPIPTLPAGWDTV